MKSKAAAEPMSPEAKSALHTIFWTVFIDLIGFAIIFPLFPAILQYYTEREGTGGLLGQMLAAVSSFTQFAGEGATQGRVPIVLFGGILGSIYSALQFLFAPMWGALSDRFGRKPILLLCLLGIALSYVGWFFASTFAVLILARTVSGIMAGNISAATAAIADVTSEKTRSRGMAIIGIAFGLGFIIGPAVGGILSHWDLTKMWPELAAYGVNPFSLPAAFALFLTLINIFFVIFRLRETLPASRRGKETTQRVINPLAVLQTTQYPGVTSTILTYFIYLTIFSGMEFTLTFLAVERLAYTPMQNGLMFVFIGLTLALVQGGYVRRKAHDVGEKRMALQGLTLILPGLLLVGFAHAAFALYAGLFFLSIGSSFVIPCLTSLVSLYTPETAQGRVLGIFRSMGALSRALGPLIACVLYWRLSSTWAYIIGAAMMLAPILFAIQLPQPTTQPART